MWALLDGYAFGATNIATNKKCQSVLVLALRLVLCVANLMNLLEIY